MNLDVDIAAVFAMLFLQTTTVVDSDALWAQRRNVHRTAVPPRLPQVHTFDQSRHFAKLFGDQRRAASRADLAQQQIARRAQRQPRGGGSGPARGRYLPGRGGLACSLLI